MHPLYKSAVSLAIFAATAAGGVSAAQACVHTVWKNTNPSHVVQRIIGRKCGAMLSIRAKGYCQQGGMCDMGWTSASQVSTHRFMATYFNNSVANHLRMTTSPAGTMHVSIRTVPNGGPATVWTGQFKLVATY